MIDLTDTERYYNSELDLPPGVSYIKIPIRGKVVPDKVAVELFCNSLSKAILDGCVAVHCTHGLNRTGFLLVSYLCKIHNMPLQAALDEF